MEISNCSCGRKAEVMFQWRTEGYLVECTRKFNGIFGNTKNGCWSGPLRKTKSVSIRAWNKIMEKKEPEIRFASPNECDS